MFFFDLDSMWSFIFILGEKFVCGRIRADLSKTIEQSFGGTVTVHLIEIISNEEILLIGNSEVIAGLGSF